MLKFWQACGILAFGIVAPLWQKWKSANAWHATHVHPHLLVLACSPCLALCSTATCGSLVPACNRVPTAPSGNCAQHLYACLAPALGTLSHCPPQCATARELEQTCPGQTPLRNTVISAFWRVQQTPMLSAHSSPQWAQQCAGVPSQTDVRVPQERVPGRLQGHCQEPRLCYLARKLSQHKHGVLPCSQA